MPEQELSIDTVLKMALSTARQHAKKHTAEKPDSPELRLAVAKVWALIKGRLPASQVAELDPLVQQITARKDRS